MNIVIASYEWSNAYTKNDINIALNIFYEVVLNAIE